MDGVGAARLPGACRLIAILVPVVGGCAAPCASSLCAGAVDDAIGRFVAIRSAAEAEESSAATARRFEAFASGDPAVASVFALADAACTKSSTQPPASGPQSPTGTQPAEAPREGPSTFEPPPGYWRPNVFRQMGGESLQLIKHELWRDFKTPFWNLENALVLTATMGASIAIRETGVDDTIANRIDGHRQLGDMDETIQILGNPGTHFAGAAALWLGSTLAQDMESHELSKTLLEALIVNDLVTLGLKVSTNTSSPDGERYAWPSGHTSSAFTVAAVLNEYYGPWVGVPSLALAGLVGYQRLDSQTHDFSDVVFGAMLGYIVGASIARDKKADFPELFGLKVLPYADPQTGAAGIALYKQW
jgi:membrane-associated phospholipid phosphatase